MRNERTKERAQPWMCVYTFPVKLRQPIIVCFNLKTNKEILCVNEAKKENILLGMGKKNSTRIEHMQFIT